MIGKSLGHYEIVALLGTGGMGRVYRARDTHLDRDVAIKVLPEDFAGDPQRLARFEREAKLLASLNHANIAVVFGFEEDDGVPFIAMELIEGDTLGDRMLRGRLELSEALGIARQIAEALEVAHDHGIIHRDLKPPNIKLRPDGTAKVLDFGLAKAVIGGGRQQSLIELTRSPTAVPETQSGVIMGTVPYMSPEQIRGQEADARADLWAFGCVLYEVLVGRGPFQRETVADTFTAVLEHEPDWEVLPETTPEHIRSLLRRCLRKDPRGRLHHAADARIEIEEALATLSGLDALPSRMPSRGTARPGRGVSPRIAWVVAAVAVIAAGAVVALDILGGLGPAAEPEADTTPVRFTVPLPQGAAISPGEVQTYVAVSPGGLLLAFSSDGSSDPLWLHSFADSTSRPLAGTDGARSPFWSPDGRFVGFFAEGKLKKVDVASGLTQLVCDAPWEAGNSWSEQGTILFSQPFEGGPVIHRVSADGGEPTPVSVLDAEREVAHFWPEFLPDGRHFFYLAIEKSTEVVPPRTLYVASLDGEQRRPIPGIASRVAYVPGYLLYVNEGMLVARPFDVDRLEFTGEPQPITDELRYFHMTGQAEFSASRSQTRSLVAFHGSPWVSRLVKYNRSGQPRQELGEPAAFDQLRIAPDGERVAVDVLDPGNGGRDLWIYSVDGDRAPRRLTLRAADERHAVWSPDGDRIVFRSDINGPPDLYVSDADGAGEQEALLNLPAVVTPDDWSPSGDEILFRVDARATGSDMASLRLDNQERRTLLATRYAEWGGRFAPDGSLIAFVSNESGRSQVYVAPPQDPGARQPVSTDGGISPAWGPGGTELYYLGPDRMVMAVSVQTTPVLDIDEPRRLFRLSADARQGAFDVTPDGQTFIVNEVVEDTRFSPINVILNWPGR